jgi:hypothetical protein
MHANALKKNLSNNWHAFKHFSSKKTTFWANCIRNPIYQFSYESFTAVCQKSSPESPDTDSDYRNNDSHDSDDEILLDNV